MRFLKTSWKPQGVYSNQALAMSENSAIFGVPDFKDLNFKRWDMSFKFAMTKKCLYLETFPVLDCCKLLIFLCCFQESYNGAISYFSYIFFNHLFILYFCLKGIHVMKKYDFVVFEVKYLEHYTSKNPILKYDVIVRRKSHILKYNWRSLIARPIRNDLQKKQYFD
jgi:hypothetical protein